MAALSLQILLHPFISLDTFRSVVQNIDTEQKAWLSFLTADEPDKIVRLVNAYPEFLPCYRDIISFRRRPKDLITTFSDALREMDRNTEIYMFEQLAKEVQEKDHALAEKDNAITEKDNVIAEKDNALAEKDNVIAEKDNALAEKDNVIAERNNALAEKDKLIRQLQKQLAETRTTD
jgi:hypothetical protein